MQDSSKLRNIAIIAHIDHGKTTLIDGIFKSAHLFRDNQQIEERVMDAGTIERERGITIKAKHCTVEWQGYKINIVDTPGHADFSGEVERVLSMVDSVLLLVDANEGPMPQTRYVLMQALKLGLNPIVIVNKVDRPNSDPDEALDKTFDLFIELGATEKQCDFPILYGSGLQGWFVDDLNKHPDNTKAGMDDLFKILIEKVPAPKAVMDAPFKMQVSTLSWSDYLGRIGGGRILQGTLKKGDRIVRTNTKWDNYDQTSWSIVSNDTSTCSHLYVTNGLERTEVESAGAGDIVWFTGPENIDLGDTIASPELTGEEHIMPPLGIEEPTISMFFLVNTSPFAGKDGNAITLRQLKARIERETKSDPALRMEDIGRADGVKVSGRGELHLGILIEEIRREGSELAVSRPEVIVQYDSNGKKLEPMEEVMIDVPEEYQGIVIQKLALRKGELVNMENTGTGTLRMLFKISTRGLIGYRGEFLTDTRGLGIMASRFVGYDEWVGEITSRSHGSLVSMETGTATAYSLHNLQERGRLFIKPGDEIYNGQVVGEAARDMDLACNPAKRKQQVNFRSATKDMIVVLDVPKIMNVDNALEWIGEDELVEVTPNNVRIRKMILNLDERRKSQKKSGRDEEEE
ncbi:MAG: translational GTPase TypA [Synergistaceae bacterium]|jgi:GTP-binding protein|nr:translational GTPase TypA [Synergistaceae bacterium]